jgi:hypothetical protein
MVVIAKGVSLPAGQNVQLLCLFRMRARQTSRALAFYSPQDDPKSADFLFI